jgi:hypothetical protein
MQAHQMHANPQVSGHLILHCQQCGYRVQIDQRTLEKKTLERGDRSAFHRWTVSLSVRLNAESEE